MLNKIFLVFFNYFLNLVDLLNKLRIKNFFKKNLQYSSLVIIDIGAHKGETINFFIRNFNISKIYAFEANKELEKILLKKKEINPEKIELLNYGVGDEEKFIPLNVIIDTASSTFNEIDTSSKYYIRKNKILSLFSKRRSFIDKIQQTKIIKLSTFINEKKIEKIDVLKIDTEGFEYKVLKGIQKIDFKKIRFIYLEHHFDTMIKKNYKFSDINNLLKKNNFKQRYKIKMSFRKSFEYIYEKKD